MANDEVSRVVDQLRADLSDLRLPRTLLEKVRPTNVGSRRLHAAVAAASLVASHGHPTSHTTPLCCVQIVCSRGTHIQSQQLRQCVQTLWQLTGAHSAEGQAALLRRLRHVPELFVQLPANLKDKVEALHGLLCDNHGVPEPLLQRLLSEQPAVLTFRPQQLGLRLQLTAEELCLPPQSVVELWLRHRTLINLAPATLSAKLAALDELLELPRPDVVRIVVAQPAVAVSDTDTLNQRLQQLRRLFHGPAGAAVATPADDGVHNTDSAGSKQRLGQALLKQPAALTYSVPTLTARVEAVEAYARAHVPSAAQLTQRRHSSGALSLLSRPRARYQVLRKLLDEAGVQLEGRGASTQRVDTSTVERRQQQQQPLSATGDQLLPNSAPSLTVVLHNRGRAFEQLLTTWLPQVAI